MAGQIMLPCNVGGSARQLRLQDRFFQLRRSSSAGVSNTSRETTLAQELSSPSLAFVLYMFAY